MLNVGTASGCGRGDVGKLRDFVVAVVGYVIVVVLDCGGCRCLCHVWAGSVCIVCVMSCLGGVCIAWCIDRD